MDGVNDEDVHPGNMIRGQQIGARAVRPGPLYLNGQAQILEQPTRPVADETTTSGSGTPGQNQGRGEYAAQDKSEQPQNAQGHAHESREKPNFS